MEKFTPGPWQVETDRADDGTPWIRVKQTMPDGEEITICTMGTSRGEVWGGYVGEEADAQLIASAPTMLGALRAIVNTCKFNCTQDSYCGTCEQALRAISAAGANIEE